MEVVSETLEPKNLNYSTDFDGNEESEIQRINDDKNDKILYSLNPLLNESLNNLVKRFDRTKIPKAPLGKGQSYRKRPRLHNSLPNIFLPSNFDDPKYLNSEKKVQWTNKLSMDFEKIKNYLCENFNNFSKMKQRSQSIPTLMRVSEDMELSDPTLSNPNIDFVCLRSKDEHNMTIKFTKCDLKSMPDNGDQEESSQTKSISTSVTECDKSDNIFGDGGSQGVPSDQNQSEDKAPYSTHLYLDGAIIEPISPASPPQSATAPKSSHSAEETQDPQNEESEAPVLNSSVSIKAKRGRKPRKKKSQNFTSRKSKAANSAASSNRANSKDLEVESMDAPSLEPEVINESSDIIIINLSNDIEAVNFVDSSKPESPQESRNSPDQTNDLEILSKSITNSSVDTSMLPPRKRYKRLMYLENNKQTSPKDPPNAEGLRQSDLKGVDDEIDNSKDPDENLEEKETSKATLPRSRSKRKKKTVSSFVKSTPEKKPITPVKLSSDTAEQMECDVTPGVKEETEKETVEEKISETVAKPESLKRSKREAAARGFANMVAMSLNNSNSSQSQDNSIDSKQNTATKKSSSSRPDSNDTSSETSGGKVFKRPRKSKNIDLGPSKSKIKRASSPPSISNDGKNPVELAPSKELEIVDVDKPKVSKRLKEKNVPDEAPPPSPNETIISNDSVGNQENVKYRKIRTNTFIDPKPPYWCEELEKCGCKSSKLRSALDVAEAVKSGCKGNASKKRLGVVWDCGDNCLNRLTYTECQAKICPCADTCGNQKIRKGEWAPGLKMKDFPGKGKGVQTTKPIRDGTFIIEYVGEVINEHTFQDRMMNLYRDDSHHYCLHLDGDLLIDAYRSGSLARLVNHSCQPNCEMQKWMVNGAYRMCLFATENIPADAELTYDYNFCSFNTKNTQICVCGSASCRGFIGSKPRAEQTESQRDRKKLYIFGRLLSGREKLFIVRNSIFLLRNRELGRCNRLGIRKPQVSHGNRLPSTITEIKRRKAKKNQFLTQMSALNSIRSIKTRQLQNAQENENLTRTAQLGQVLRDLYNTLLEQKDPLNPALQLVAPFIHGLNRKKYPEFYRMVGQDAVASLHQVYGRLLEGGYKTMLAFDQDVLQMLQNVELYAGKQSNIGQCAERIKPVYKELKMNSIALLEALTDEPCDDRDKQKLVSNNLQQVASALAAIKSQSAEVDLPEPGASGAQRSKRRKQAAASSTSGNRGRLERGAEVIKCICGFLIEAGHVMVQCDRCFVWQHAYCMNVARSSELADVTRMEPYYCHVCLNISQDALIREIPRHFVISDETIGSDNTLFWTLLKADSLFKIDDFVYIASDSESPRPPGNARPKSSKGSPSSPFSMPTDLTRRTIMRIYSLWKDSTGQRWMEGGLFLRPYDGRLGDRDSTKVGGTNKRKSSASAIDLATHKWHQFEVVYTDFTKILPLDCCLGRCFVLNSYTFRHGRPLLQNSTPNNSLDVFVCDWMVNTNSEWSELDPAYLKINTKPYCFEKFQDDPAASSSERFCRQYLAEDLLNIDEGFKPCVESNASKVNPTNQRSPEERIAMKMNALMKIIDKLVEFAKERNQNFPLSSTTSSVSGSSSSSRGASPLCENSGTKSPMRALIEPMYHGVRKSLTPRKLVKESETSEPGDKALPRLVSSEPVKEAAATIASDVSDNSPQLMIVVDEFQQTPKNDVTAGVEDPSKTAEKSSSVDEKDAEEKTVSSVKENVDDQSNLGSEINFGDFVNLLKNSEPLDSCVSEKVPSGAKSSKQKSSKISPKVSKKSAKRPKRRVAVKKGELKPVSEIDPAEDEWVPTNSVVEVSVNRPRTRSRKAASLPLASDGGDACGESSSNNHDNGTKTNGNAEVELILTGANIKKIFISNESPAKEVSSDPQVAAADFHKTEEEEDESTKSCFVKLERMKVKQKKDRDGVKASAEDQPTSRTAKLTEALTLNVGEHNPDVFSTENLITKPESIDKTSSSKTFSKSKSQPNSSSSSVQSDTSKQESSNPLSSSQIVVSGNRNLSDDNEADGKPDSKNSNASSSANRSKRKKGVPKRIPFDFSYPQINVIKSVPSVPEISSSTFEGEVVDLSSSKTGSSDQPEPQSAINTQELEAPEPSSHPTESTVAVPEPTATVASVTSTVTSEGRHITAANDFSSIENISSN